MSAASPRRRPRRRGRDATSPASRSGVHLAEGDVVAVGHEDRVVAEAVLPARRPDEPAVDLAAEQVGAAVGEGEGEDRDEVRLRCSGRRDAERLELLLDAAHGRWRNPCPGRPSAPSRRRARRQAPRPRAPNRRRARAGRRRSRRRRAFSAAFSSKVTPVSSGSGRPSSPAETTDIPIGRDQRLDLAELARVVGGDHQPFAAFERARHQGDRQRIASFCSSTSWPMPPLASARSAWSSSSVNGAPSAVPWISTMPPDPVMTKLASVSASLSST